MHPGIGPPGGSHPYGMPGHPRQREFKRILSAATSTLTLPTAKSTAIVFQAQGDSH
jgi:hypothetical protein